jgi:hypothetical protein
VFFLNRFLSGDFTGFEICDDTRVFGLYDLLDGEEFFHILPATTFIKGPLGDLFLLLVCLAGGAGLLTGRLQQNHRFRWVWTGISLVIAFLLAWRFCSGPHIPC